MKPVPSLFSRIRTTLALLILAVCGSFWAVVYVGETSLERLSLHAWLKSEAKRVSIEYLKGNSDYLPDPNVFSFYRESSSELIPNWLMDYNSIGLYEHLLGPEDKHFIISQYANSSERFYIVFQHNADDFLDEYETELYQKSLLIVVVAVIVIFLYCHLLSLWLSRPLSVIQEQARSVGRRDKKIKVDTKYRETQDIEESLIQSQNELEQFIQRENEFNRFASHELRTPIAVIAGSIELLKDVNYDPNSRIGARTVTRMESASKEMQLLTDAFLLLGQKNIEEDRIQQCDLSVIINTQIDKFSTLFRHQQVEVNFQCKEPAIISSPESFITIAVNNLLKNAFSYGEKSIDIILEGGLLQVVNQHRANKNDLAGYGVGLVIVERVSQRMGWEFSVQDNQTHFITHINFLSSSQ